MIRKIIKIDEEKCNGCGACVSACHEGAIGLVDGKAKLMRDDYCDGLGDCLHALPVPFPLSREKRQTTTKKPLWKTGSRSTALLITADARVQGSAESCTGTTRIQI